MDVEQNCCVVTGAGSGIGEATARALRAAGARLVLLDVRREAADHVAEELRDLGGDVRSYGADVSSWDEMEQFYAWTRSEVGTVDVLVNCAGILHAGGVMDTSVEQFRRVFDVNYWGAVYGSKLFLPSMLERGKGAIVNVASASGVVGFAPIAAYSSSKFALVGFSAALRAEVEARGVTVCTVCPGLVRTGLAEHSPLPEEARASITEYLAQKGMPASVVAEAIVGGIRKKRREIHVGADAKAIAALDRLAPGHASGWLNRWVNFR